MQTCSTNWSTFYPILKRTLKHYKLDGIDIDIEAHITLSDAQKLVDHLNR